MVSQPSIRLVSPHESQAASKSRVSTAGQCRHIHCSMASVVSVVIAHTETAHRPWRFPDGVSIRRSVTAFASLCWPSP